MSQSHAKRGTDSPQTQLQKRRVNKQNSPTQYGLTGSGTRLLESHGVFTDLYQAIVRMHQTLIFFFLNYPFTAWGVAASRAQHLAKSFIPPSIPTIPARMKTHITADSKKARATSSRQQKSLGHRMKPRAQFLDKNEERVGDNNDSIKMLFLTHNSCTFIHECTGLSVHPLPWS